MLDLEALRLTEAEKNVAGLFSIHSQQRDHVAKVQFAKLADGIRIWLYSQIDGAVGIARVQMELEDAMKEAGIKWPI